MSEITAAIIHFEALRAAVNAALWTLYREVEAAQLDAPTVTHIEPKELP